MPVPVHELATTERVPPVLDGHATVSPAGERFAYNNGGYVVLALLAERASGVAFHDLVRQRWSASRPGMVDTAFLRSDELPGGAALGYLADDGLRTNVLHLPVLGSGDGGIYSTAADLHAFWDALFAGRIVPPERVAEMVRPRSDWPEESRRYGLGFHLHATGDVVWLEGYDAGVSFRQRARPHVAHHLHRHLQLVRWCVGPHLGPRRASSGSSESGEAEHGRDLPMVVDDMVGLGARGRCLPEPGVPHRHHPQRLRARDVGATVVPDVRRVGGIRDVERLERRQERLGRRLEPPGLIAERPSVEPSQQARTP